MNADNLRRLLEALGSTKLRGPDSKGNIHGCCPLARWTHAGGRDESPSFSALAADGAPSKYTCFACGAKGLSVVTLAARMNNLSDGKYAEAEKFAREKDGVDPAGGASDVVTSLTNRAVVSSDRPEDVWEDKDFAAFAGRVPQYAIDRGLEMSTCRAWGLGYDMAEKRLVFPIRGADGKLVGVTGRALPGCDVRAPRYKDYFGFRKASYLYGEWMYGKPAERLFVVEGFMDVLLLWQRGFRNVVATMGAMASRDQVRKIRDYGVPVYLAQDNDDAGRSARSHCAGALVGRVQVWDVPLPDGGDPDELSADEFAAAVAGASII